MGQSKSGLKVAIYVRVSTEDQSSDMQLSELKEYADRQGWKIVQTYSDVESGSKADRPGLLELLSDARRGKFGAVLVWKLDRFGRSVPDFLRNIEALSGQKVRFIATTQGIDTDDTSPLGRFFLIIMAAVADLERNMIRERTRAGLREAKRKGKRLGQVPLPPWKCADIQTYRTEHPDEGTRAIAEQFGVSKSTVARFLRCPTDVQKQPLGHKGAAVPQTVKGQLMGQAIKPRWDPIIEDDN